MRFFLTYGIQKLGHMQYDIKLEAEYSPLAKLLVKTFIKKFILIILGPGCMGEIGTSQNVLFW